MVSQLYDTDVNKAYIIRGNAAVLKCEVPSFVADFVSVVSWHTDQEENFYPGDKYGMGCSCIVNVARKANGRSLCNDSFLI